MSLLNIVLAVSLCLCVCAAGVSGHGEHARGDAATMTHATHAHAHVHPSQRSARSPATRASGGAAAASPLRTVFNRIDCLRDDETISPAEMAVFVREIDNHGVESVGVQNVMQFFSPLDTDANNIVTWEEFEENYAYLNFPLDGAIPSQVHLALGAVSGTITVMWSQDTTNVSIVQWGPAAGQYNDSASGTAAAYTVDGSGPFHYTSLPIHTAIISRLLPYTTYHYRVGDGVTWSSDLVFRSAPLSGAPPSLVRWAIYGDMGTIVPMGATVTKSLEKFDALTPFDIGLHVGDLAYAGVNSHGEWEPTWDAWMIQIEPLASKWPYQVTVGNHENYFNYTAYIARFNMSGDLTGANGNFYYGFDYGNVHITSFSSELPYQPGSEQYKWIEADFIAARARNVTWLMASVHRPFYSSDKGEGYPLRANLEALLLKYKVDMVFTGHAHCYERTFPVVYGNTTAVPGQTTFVRPDAPIYLVQGTAGALQTETWLDQPAWSASRSQNYGFGVMEVTSGTTNSLTYIFKDVKLDVIDQFTIIK